MTTRRLARLVQHDAPQGHRDEEPGPHAALEPADASATTIQKAKNAKAKPSAFSHPGTLRP